MKGQLVPRRLLAVIAAKQGGVIARRQLVALGFSKAEIDHMVAHGRLHVVHRGVYAVGHTAVGTHGRRWAAVLACGESAVLSHASAAAAWGLRPSASAVIDVSVGRGGRARRPGIRLHYRRSLSADDVTALDGLPITTPARTVLDLAASGLRGAKLEAVVDVAVHERLDFGDLERLLASRQAGTAALREVVRRYAPGSVDVRSGLEVRFLELCDGGGLPRPAVNVVVCGRVRDFFWADVPLVVEVDSWRWHRSRSGRCSGTT
jgi:predicted transcriptional regulator of viral defense system